MISYLSGNILIKTEKFAILEAGGVGYKVFLSKTRALELEEGKARFFCYTNTKKDPWEIYGFASSDELELFEFLIGLSGVGPKAALEASGIGSLERMRKGIRENDPKLMEELFSLGQKKAQAIVFEISRKIKSGSGKKLSKEQEEALSALVKLGFSKTEAKESVLILPESVSGAEEMVKEALKTMTRPE